MLMSMIYWSRCWRCSWCWWWQSPSCGWWGRAGRWRQTQQRRRASTGHHCVRNKNTWWGVCSASQCAKFWLFWKRKIWQKHYLKGSQTFSGRSFRLIVQKPSLIAPQPILLPSLDLAGIDLVKIMSQVSFSTSTTIGHFKSQPLG